MYHLSHEGHTKTICGNWPKSEKIGNISCTMITPGKLSSHTSNKPKANLLRISSMNKTCRSTSRMSSSWTNLKKWSRLLDIHHTHPQTGSPGNLPLSPPSLSASWQKQKKKIAVCSLKWSQSHLLSARIAWWMTTPKRRESKKGSPSTPMTTKK